MPSFIHPEKVIGIIQSFYMFSDITESDAETILDIGAEILNVSKREMLRLIQEA